MIQWINWDCGGLRPRDYITILRAVHVNSPLQAIEWFKWENTLKFEKQRKNSKEKIQTYLTTMGLEPTTSGLLEQRSNPCTTEPDDRDSLNCVYTTLDGRK